MGVVGLGGLGHMAVKFAHAFGAHTVVFTTSPNKTEDALRLGADVQLTRFNYPFSFIPRTDAYSAFICRNVRWGMVA